MAHAPGAGDEVLIGARLAGGAELTAVAFVDASSAVKDAFVVPEAIDDVIRTAADRNTDPDTRFVAMSLADARGWLQPGLRQPSLDRSDSWPACRPLLRWLAGRLPEGGTRAGQ
ncbi:hypothetical protein ACTWP6_08740 [Mycobacterium sp. 4D054]|uniref:hypothetical protein n=1 Tax=unclassified Mycobacterium TaxID=2642494 RepID=UPI0021B3FF71|nr:hypothetical protein [Mycobacterium sp. SMC-8]